MSREFPDVVVAGHICLDIIPEINNQSVHISDMLQPGKLLEVGNALMSTGGAVSNTGIALQRLGFSTALMGKIGDDVFGKVILELLNDSDQGLSKGMIVGKGEQSSYSLVISPPNSDRIFLHCPGANNTFIAEDIPIEQIEYAKLFHFGYPPLMYHMFQDEGTELVEVFQKVKDRGLTTSLDMAQPDPESEAGKVDWGKILDNVLPHVDIFLPSFEEIVYMLDPVFDHELSKLIEVKGMLGAINEGILTRISDELLAKGTAIVVIKLGDYGLYLRTISDENRLIAMNLFSSDDVNQWKKQELFAPCFKVNVQGTTGAGDCTIAGFLGGLMKGLSPSDALKSAVAVGAFNVQVPDAVSGIPNWQEVEEFLANEPDTLSTDIIMKNAN